MVTRGPLRVRERGQGAANWQMPRFVFFRLADSLPPERLDDWLRTRQVFLAAHPPHWDDITEACYHGQFSDTLDEPLGNITDAT